MTFEDDEQRDYFHKEVPPTLQIIATIFESECWQYGQEVILIDVLQPNRILLGCPYMDPQAMQFVAESITARFARKDRRSTCIVDDVDLGTFILTADQASSLKHLN